jgi:conjugal transfer pilus assembly protein TraV
MSTRRHPRQAAVVTVCAALSGCGNLSGLDGTSSYACKAPDGVHCESVSGTYYNALQSNLPSQRKLPSSESLPSAPPASLLPRRPAVNTSASAQTAAPLEAPAALRSSPRVLRLWIKPWEDADHDLNGESMVYVQVDEGRWLLEHVQEQARAPYLPTRLRTPGDPASAKAATASSPVPVPPTGSGLPVGGGAIAAKQGSPGEEAAAALQAIRTLQPGSTTAVNH